MATQNFKVGIPVANVIKFTRDDISKNQRANFDQQSFDQAVHASTQENFFALPFEKTDPIRVQFYNNFPAVRIELIRIYNGKTTIESFGTPTVAKSYTNKKYRSACKFSSIDGKLFIYFDEGPEYEDEDFTVQGDVVDLEGRLPNVNVKVGDNIRFKIDGGSFEFTEVASIEWLPTLQAQGFLTDVDYTISSPVDGVVEVTYDEKPTDLYAHSVSLVGVPDGCYRLRLKFGISTSAYSVQFTSEPMDVQDEHERSLALIYRHAGDYNRADIWQYEYLGDWTQLIRLPAEFYKFEPAGEVEVYLNDSGRPDMTRAVPYRQMTFTAFNIPSWLVDKLNVIFSHDSKEINGYHWENENFGSKENVDRTDISTFSIQLRQVEDRTIFDSDFTAEITASWTPSSFTNLAFGGAVVEAVFNTNLLDSVFGFQDLPDWITPDVETFQDGDTVTFTIAANAALFERLETLVAFTEAFEDLLASISFHQLYDTTTPPPPEFLEVSDDDVQINWPAGSDVQIAVSASGDYDISYSGDHEFTAVKENGILNVRISEPTANEGTPRTGVVRLTLQSNPAIFVDIDVTQLQQVGLISVTESSLTYPSNGGSQNVDVVAEAGTQWQASASQPYVIVSGAIKTGSQTLNIFLNGRDLYLPAPRFSTVTLVNVNNPSDVLVVSIQQN